MGCRSPHFHCHNYDEFVMLDVDKRELIMRHVDTEVFHIVGDAADSLHRECYVVGGYVRDIFLHRHSKDIDFVTVGSGIELAETVAKRLGRKTSIAVYRNFGTAQVRAKGMELEFVGARRESYNRNSRKPIVEDGTLSDDQCRRDFTINAMAICVNKDRYGELLDPFGGLDDMRKRIIRTPLDPDITFSDDPLRMMRAVRFATQLNFEIYPDTFSALCRNKNRIEIISYERIETELMKIMESEHPSRGFKMLNDCGLLRIIFPELAALSGVETVKGRGHKDNFLHTMQVLENVAAKSDNVWLRWAALLHDIAKPVTKRYDAQLGWTFHNHNFIGEKMIPRIFKRMKFPMNEHMKYVQKLVGLHMRPIALVEDEVTDSAVRRLLFDAGDDIDDLMTLCEADITSKNQEKVRRFLDNFALVRKKLVELEEKDRVRNFQPPVTGECIMSTFAIGPCREVGTIKEAIKNAILDGKIANDYIEAYNFMLKEAAKLGLKPADDVKTDDELRNEIFAEAFESPIGWMLVRASHNGVRECRFSVERPNLGGLCGNEVTALAVKELKEYFDGKLRQFTVRLDIADDTEFRKKAWNALLTIPYGKTISYAEEAALAGNPSATRAIGAANAKNPVCVIVPCHRVIASDGTPGGYSAGVARKLHLIALEKNRR